MNKIIEQINNSKTFAIFAHIKTDCDAVCSCLAFKFAMQQLGKSADIFIDSAFSDTIKSLIGADCLNVKTIESYDSYVCLDNAVIDRLGKNKYKVMKNRNKSFQLDHHLTNELYCKINFVDESYSSACEILFELFNKLGITFTPEISELLLIGILTDTGKLSFRNASSKTFITAGKLLSYTNKTIDQICEPIFSSLSMSEYNMKKFAYNNLKLHYNDTVAILCIDTQDFENLGAKFEDTIGLADIGTALVTVKLTILASADPSQEDCYYVSVRSKAQTSARKVCEAFGGGGHLNAAGCKIFDTKENVINRLLTEAKKVI